MRNKKLMVAAGILAVMVTSLPSAFAAQGEPWFDLENCSMCKHMTAEEGLIEHVKWDNHLTADGMMTVTVVADGYEKTFEKAMKNMQVTGGELASGKDLYLCGFCKSYGALHQAGANNEYFKTVGGHVNLVTSRDPDLVTKIHTHGQRTIDEFAKMTAGADHGDHSHGDHDGHHH